MLKHIGSNWTQNLLQIAVMMVLTPFMIGALGGDTFGIWLAIGAITGYLQLLVLGVPMASVRHIAEGVARGDTASANRAVSTSLALCLSLGVLALGVGATLYPAFMRGIVTRWDGLTPDALHDARLAYWLVVLQVASGFVMRLPYAVYDAYEEFPVRNAIMCGGLVLRLGLVIGLLSWRAEVSTLAIVIIIQQVVEYFAAVGVFKRRHPEVRFRLSGYERGMVASIFGFSVYATLLNFGTQLAYRTDALVIGRYLDGTAITDFDVGNKFFDPLTSFLLGIGMVVMPVATRFQGSGRMDELRDVFLRWSKISFSIVLMVGLYLLVLGPEFLGWWIEPRYEAASGPVLQVLMASFLVYLPVRAVAVPVLLGLGVPRKPAIGILVMGVVNLGISVALVGSMGIFGVALGTALPNVVFAFWMLHLACRELQTSMWSYLKYVGGRALLGTLPGLALLLSLKYGLDVNGFFPLMLSGIAFVGLFGLTWITFVYRNDPYVDLRGRAGGLLARFSRGASS